MTWPGITIYLILAVEGKTNVSYLLIGSQPERITTGYFNSRKYGEPTSHSG